MQYPSFSVNKFY